MQGHYFKISVLNIHLIMLMQMMCIKINQALGRPLQSSHLRFVSLKVKGKMKSDQKARNIYQILKPFYLLLSVFCLATYKFDRKTRKLTLTAPGIVAFVVTLCFWAWTILYRLEQDMSFDPEPRLKLLDRLWAIQYNLHHILGLLIMIVNFAKRTTVANILELLNNFDRQVKSLGWNFEASLRFYSLMIAQFVISSVIFLAQCIHLWFLAENVMIEHFIAYVLVMGVFLLTCQQFAIAANFIDVRLSKMIDNVE